MADTPKVYAICDANCRWETLTREQILTAITQAVSTGEVSDVDTGFVQTIKTINGIGLKFFVGEQSEYDALSEEDKQNLFAIITNDVSKDTVLAAVNELSNEVTELATSYLGILNGAIMVGHAANAENASHAIQAETATNAINSSKAKRADNATNATNATNDGNGYTLYGRKTLWSGTTVIEAGGYARFVTTESAALKYIIIQTDSVRTFPMYFDTSKYVSVTEGFDCLGQNFWVVIDNQNANSVMIYNKGNIEITIQKIFAEP